MGSIDIIEPLSPLIINKKFPVIGITLDSEDSSKGGYSHFPWYAIRKNYVNAVVKVGGIPIILPHEIDLIDNYLNMIDGLVITGGDFDVDPSMYGEKLIHETMILKTDRTEFETGIIRAALDINLPLLGFNSSLSVQYGVRVPLLIQYTGTVVLIRVR